MKKRFCLQTKLHPHFPTLDSLGNRISTCLLNQEFDNHSIQLFPLPALKCMPISAHFLRTSAEKMGVRMSAAKKGLEVLLRGIVAGSFSTGRKKSSHAARTSVAHSTPRMLCVTHTIPRVQAGPNALANRLLPQTLEEACASHWRPLLTPGLGPRITLFNTLQGMSQRRNRVFEVLFHSSSRVTFLPKMLSLRSGSWNSFPLSLAASIFHRASAFWLSLGFLTPAALLITLQ